VQSRTRPRRYLMGYLLPVVALAVALNVPKVFEVLPSHVFSSEYDEVSAEGNGGFSPFKFFFKHFLALKVGANLARGGKPIWRRRELGKLAWALSKGTRKA